MSEISNSVNESLNNEENTTKLNNIIKIKIDDVTNLNNLPSLNLPNKRNIIQKKRSDYDEYLEKSSSTRSRKKHRGTGI